MKRSPIRRSNPERAAAAKVAHFGPLAVYVRTLPCDVCGLPGPSQACHVRTRGAGNGAWITLPGGLVVGNIYAGCAACHREEGRGRLTFQRVNGVDLAVAAVRHGYDFLTRGEWCAV